MAVWLVTGGSGFLGRPALEAVDAHRAAEDRVVALGRRCPSRWPEDHWVRGDLEDPAGLIAAVRAIGPDIVIHAAGLTPPAAPEALYRANTLGTVHLLDALRACARPIRAVLVGSAAEIGPVAPEALPVREDHPCRPADAYGLSKWLATCAGLAAGPPLDVVGARVFNPVGPGMPPLLAFGRFAERLAGTMGDPLVLEVGDLDARRDFIDVRDVAEALVALARSGRPGRIYHVGTGVSRRVGEGLDVLVRLSRRRVRIEPAGAPARPHPVRDSRAAIGRIVAQTGWRPRVAWEQSLADLWDDARRRGGWR